MTSKTESTHCFAPLETHGEVDDDRLPEWSEFQKLVTDYEIEQ